MPKSKNGAADRRNTETCRSATESHQNHRPLPNVTRTHAGGIIGRCGSPRSFPAPPRCCSPSASATRWSPSRTSATGRPRPRSIPHLTRTVIPAGLSAREIDETVRATVGAGRPLYELDAERLEELAPDLIVTQAVCDVCAVSYDDVVAVAAQLPEPAARGVARPDDARRGAGRLRPAGRGDRRRARGAHGARAGAAAHRGGPAGGRRRTRPAGCSRSSGSTRRSSPVTGCRR